jgi:hypothetical protein
MAIFDRTRATSDGRARRRAAWLPVVLIAALAGCRGVDAAPREAPTQLSGTERQYVVQTARAVYRRGPIEYTPSFLFAGADGYGVCVRTAGAGANGGDYTLLVLQRRIGDEAIPQAADDVLIYRRSSEVQGCRRVGADAERWSPVR